MLLNLQNAKPNCTLKFDALYLTRLGMYYARKRIHSRVKNESQSLKTFFVLEELVIQDIKVVVVV